jgi:hypothetical protein
VLVLHKVERIHLRHSWPELALTPVRLVSPQKQARVFNSLTTDVIF